MSSFEIDAAGTIIRSVDGVAIPEDARNADYRAYLAWQATGGIATVSAPPAPTVDDYTAAVQGMVDAAARSKNYTDGVSLASYASSTNAQWAAEATAFIAWRDRVWTSVYTTMAAVQSGQQAQPTIDALIAGLPSISWPQ